MTVEDHSTFATSNLTAREVSQLLREVTFGRRQMTKVGAQTWDEVYSCHFMIAVDGWRITFFNDCDSLDYCEEAISPEGLQWRFESGDRFGTDPIALLSTWELLTLERMLKEL